MKYLFNHSKLPVFLLVFGAATSPTLAGELVVSEINAHYHPPLLRLFDGNVTGTIQPEEGYRFLVVDYKFHGDFSTDETPIRINRSEINLTTKDGALVKPYSAYRLDGDRRSNPQSISLRPSKNTPELYHYGISYVVPTESQSFTFSIGDKS